MVEKVARRIAAIHMGALVDLSWRHYVPDARAAIEAMGEPTNHMAEIGSFKLTAPELTTMGAIYEAREAYRAMISAVLKETP